MKNLYKGLSVFIIHIGVIFILPWFLDNTNTAPWWYSALLGLIAVLYVYFGHQTIKKENHRLVGRLFFTLGLITMFLTYMLNTHY